MSRAGRRGRAFPLRQISAADGRAARRRAIAFDRPSARADAARAGSRRRTIPAMSRRCSTARVPPRQGAADRLSGHAGGRAPRALTPGGTWLAARSWRWTMASPPTGPAAATMRLHDTGAGYCVFNDLAIAARRLVDGGHGRRACADRRSRRAPGRRHRGADRRARGDRDLLDARREEFPARARRARRSTSRCPTASATTTISPCWQATLPPLLDAAQPDLILYQAGVDPHRERPARPARAERRRAWSRATASSCAAARDARGIPLASRRSAAAMAPIRWRSRGGTSRSDPRAC